MTETRTPNHAASLRMQIDARCGHFLWVWVNDRDQRVVDAILDDVQRTDCPRCMGEWTKGFPPEIRRFTQFL